MPKKKKVDGRAWGETVQFQAAACYVMLGNLREVSAATKVAYDTLKAWKRTDWWKDLILQIRDEDVAQLDSKIQRIVSTALSVVADRLQKGDYQYDPKTGKAIRIPVKAQIALKVTTDLLARQEKIRSAPVRAEIEKTIDARLSKLADEFHRFAKGGTKTIDVDPVVVPDELRDKPLTAIQERVINELHPPAVPFAVSSLGDNR